jgi:hypothetical protein
VEQVDRAADLTAAPGLAVLAVPGPEIEPALAALAGKGALPRSCPARLKI